MDQSIVTPSYTHLTSADFERIYEPSEDTFLFLDSLEKDRDLINDARFASLFPRTSKLKNISTPRSDCIIDKLNFVTIQLSSISQCKYFCRSSFLFFFQNNEDSEK